MAHKAAQLENYLCQRVSQKKKLTYYSFKILFYFYITFFVLDDMLEESSAIYLEAYFRTTLSMNTALSYLDEQNVQHNISIN